VGSGSLSLLRVSSEKFHITDREQQVLQFLLEGLTSKEIADRMKISPNTVKAFLRLIMMKMGVSTRSGIVGKAMTSDH
jgi:DNA-binding CsgD family transcriptional regulator